MKILLRRLALCLLVALPALSTAQTGAHAPEPFNPKEAILGHLGDKYDWEIALPRRTAVIPLPVILRDEAGMWHLFSSNRLRDGKEYRGFYLSPSGTYAGKIVCCKAGGEVYRPLDLSVTKNVLALWIGCFMVLIIILPLVRWYKHHPFTPPRRLVGGVERLIEMVYVEVLVPVLGEHARRYAPYLLTLFFFIFSVNLLGMLVIFPGGANVMGNLSITLILALCTFVVVNLSSSKHYWREIFCPDVPLWLKFPIPLLPAIELFGVFTKPLALMIRLFANMLAGHLITVVLAVLILLFGVYGRMVVGSVTVLSILFSVFMGLLDLLIGFIQAYVFMMLSAIFISLSHPPHKREMVKEKIV